ncbi:MAG: hypothetical protein ACYDA8_03465 [Deferrisomatales bacterium]
MPRALYAAVAALAVAGCVAGHLKKDIPPPGGCDQCHLQKITSDWQVTVTPVQLGREGGLPEDRDVVLAGLRRVPFHREVASRRLEVFAEAAPKEVVGDPETGIQCFVCHRSPGPPHEALRGRFHHPWGRGTGERP